MGCIKMIFGGIIGFIAFAICLLAFGSSTLVAVVVALVAFLVINVL